MWHHNACLISWRLCQTTTWRQPAQNSFFFPKTRTFSSLGSWAAPTWKRLGNIISQKYIYRVTKQATMISQALKSAEQITLGNIEILEKILKLRHSCYFASILLPPTSTWPTAVIKVSDSLLIANSFKLGVSHPFKLHVILRRVYQAINSIYICICISLNIYMLYLNLLNQIAFLLISAWNVQKLDRKFFFLLILCSRWGLNSLTNDRTCAPYTRNVKSWSLDSLGSLRKF